MQGGPLSPDEYRVASPPALLHQPASLVAVAIDRDRNSQLAVKWVVDHLLSGASQIVLLHVAAHYPTNRTSFIAVPISPLMQPPPPQKLSSCFLEHVQMGSPWLKRRRARWRPK